MYKQKHRYNLHVFLQQFSVSIASNYRKALLTAAPNGVPFHTGHYILRKPLPKLRFLKMSQFFVDLSSIIFAYLRMDKKMLN
jgi:hypothetical protein